MNDADGRIMGRGYPSICVQTAVHDVRRKRRTSAAGDAGDVSRATTVSRTLGGARATKFKARQDVCHLRRRSGVTTLPVGPERATLSCIGTHHARLPPRVAGLIEAGWRMKQESSWIVGPDSTRCRQPAAAPWFGPGWLGGLSAVLPSAMRPRSSARRISRASWGYRGRTAGRRMGTRPQEPAREGLPWGVRGRAHGLAFLLPTHPHAHPGGYGTGLFGRKPSRASASDVVTIPRGVVTPDMGGQELYGV